MPVLRPPTQPKAWSSCSRLPQSISLTPSIILTGLAVGIVLSLVSAIQPSIEASHVQPNLLIRAGMHQRVTPTRQFTFVLIAAFSFAAAALSASLPAYNGLAIGGYVAVLRKQ